MDLTRFDCKIDSAENFFLANGGVEIPDIEQFRFLTLIVVLNYLAAGCSQSSTNRPFERDAE
jgi:hypothetical protein